MASSACVSRNEEFPSIRQRELQAWRDIMRSLCATASLLIFGERDAIWGVWGAATGLQLFAQHTPKMCTVHWYILIIILSWHKETAPSVRKEGEVIDLGVATNPSNMIPQAKTPNICCFSSCSYKKIWHLALFYSTVNYCEYHLDARELWWALVSVLLEPKQQTQ